jgi:hypothetical protein
MYLTFFEFCDISIVKPYIILNVCINYYCNLSFNINLINTMIINYILKLNNIIKILV